MRGGSVSEESDASDRAFATFCVDIRPAGEVRTVGRMLAPEGFIQFMEEIGVAEAKIGEITTIELRQQASRSGALQAVPKSPAQAAQGIWAIGSMAEDF